MPSDFAHFRCIQPRLSLSGTAEQFLEDGLDLLRVLVKGPRQTVQCSGLVQEHLPHMPSVPCRRFHVMVPRGKMVA